MVQQHQQSTPKSSLTENAAIGAGGFWFRRAGGKNVFMKASNTAFVAMNQVAVMSEQIESTGAAPSNTAFELYCKRS